MRRGFFAWWFASATVAGASKRTLGNSALAAAAMKLALPVRLEQGRPALLAPSGVLDQLQAILPIEESVQVVEQLRLENVHSFSWWSLHLKAHGQRPVG